MCTIGERSYTLKEVINLANQLNFKSLALNINQLLEQSINKKWTTETFLFYIFNCEQDRKEKMLKQAILRRAKFPQMKYLEDLNREDLPKNMQVVLPKLETLDFIKKTRNVVLIGNPGTGKTHVAIGLGIAACKVGYKVLFISIHELLTRINESKSARTLGQFENQFLKYDLVICDELGYVKFTKENAELLFNLFSLRAEMKSTIITTNLDLKDWHIIFGNKVLTGAIIDRVTHKSYMVNMIGHSYRTKETMLFNQKSLEST